MTDWQRTLDLRDIWDWDMDVNRIHSACEAIALRLDRLTVFPAPTPDCNGAWLNSKRDELVEEFRTLSGDINATADDFDYLMDDLYDWGDTSIDHTDTNLHRKRACWIKTS